METLKKSKTGSRRKVHQDQTPKAVDAPSNGIDADTFLVFIGQIAKQEAVVSLQKKKLGKMWKLAINSGIVRKEAEMVRKMLDQEPETVLAAISRIKQYAQWLNVPIGSQLSLFEVASGSILSSSEIGENAYRAGYLLGITGKNPDDQAYPSDNEHHQRHMEGWHDGQKVLLDRIQPIDIALDADGASGADEDEMEEAA